MTSFSEPLYNFHRVVKEFEDSTAPHYRAFCYNKNIDLANFRQARFFKNRTGTGNARLDQALSQIAADPAVDSMTLLIRNTKNAKKEVLDLLLIPDGAPYYVFEELHHNLAPVREGDMFIVDVSRRDGSRPGFMFYAIVEDEVLPEVKLGKASSIALREVSEMWRCNPRDLMATPNASTRAEFVSLLRVLDRRGISLKAQLLKGFQN